MITEAIIEQFRAIVGERHAVTDPSEIDPYLHEPRGLYHGSAPVVLRPGTVDEVSRILALATETKTPVVPQSGNTGHVGGQVPLDEQPAIIVSLSRLNTIRSIDLSANTMTVDTGCILQDIQKTASEANRLFPLSLGSEGTCQIGGNLSTNAGGTGVLAYGNARHLCLGLEVVLPTGEIWDGLRTLKKDNTGYDLRDLFIGAEGTLGIITGAVLKLLPKPKGKQVAIAGLTSPGDALSFFEIARQDCAGELTGFELMPRIGIEFTSAYIHGVRDPLERTHPWYVLIEISSMRSEDEAAATMETLLASAFEQDLIQDAVIAQSDAQREAFWQIRETMSEAQKHEGASIKHDVSVPVSAIPEFFKVAGKAVHEAMPEGRIYAFGHMGDGNIHYNVQQPKGGDGPAHLARRHEINDTVYDIALGMGGSISAEHGIGQMKRDKLAAIRQSIEIDLMRRIKNTFDPANIMNPGKIVLVERNT